MRSRARAVVIGGGVGGCSVLYWLTRLGWDDVVLVERADLTSGSTFHSAGLVGQLRSTLSLTKMMMASVDLYRSLEDEVGLETGWHEVGSLRLASAPERMEEIARQAGWAKTFGLPLELISADEARALFPPMTTEGVLGAAFLPTDGYIDPSQLTFALAEGARRRGAEIETGTRVTDVVVRRSRVAGVETDRGSIECDVVVNAGGMYAKEIGALAGVEVPIVPMAHEYLITKPTGLPLEMPTMRDPSLLVYFRPESGGLIMGGYERLCAPWGLDGIPADFNSRLLEEDWPRFEELLENAVVRVPSLSEMEVVKLINGPEAFTPDGEFILGPTDVRGFWVAAGFCAHGLAGAGGMGKLVAEWIVEGTPSLDVWHMDSRRFGLAYRSREYTLTRTREIYETYYDVKYPGHERAAGRPLRVSSAYARLQELGAAFGEKSGWERANWFEPNAARGDESRRPRGWAGELWSPAIGVEHLACREAAAIFDESSFAKIGVSGEGAAELLERLCGNRVAREVGQVTYTQMLNPRGGIECDFTVTRLAEDRFRIVTGTAFGQHDLAWIRQHVPEDGSVQVEDETSAYSCFGVWGPKAREILQPLTTADLSNEAFSYMHAQELAIGRVPCLAKDHSLAALARQVRESRELLGDHLDLYQVHSATLDSGVLSDRAVLDELARLRDDGLVIGLSSSGPGQAATIRRALEATAGGVAPFACVQATWNLLEPSAGPALAEASAAGWGVIVKEAVANGRLTPHGHGPAAAVLERVAAGHGVGVDAVALAAVLANPWADVVLSGAVTPAQLEANLAAVRVELTPGDLQELAALAEPPERYWEERSALSWS